MSRTEASTVQGRGHRRRVPDRRFGACDVLRGVGWRGGGGMEAVRKVRKDYVAGNANRC